MKCPKCGKQIPNNELFCAECGLRLPTYKYVCPKCKKGYNDERHFCGECGTQLKSTFKGERTYLTPSEKALYIITWIVCISGALILSYFILKGVFA